MTKEELWKIYCDKNSQFSGNGNVTMSAQGLRKLFEQTWDIAARNASKDRDKDHSALDDFYSTIFGKNRK